MTKLIAIYGRVSTSNQENEGTIETQLSAVREFAQKNNYSIVKEYTDEGWSGDSIIRPALDQLRIDAKSKIWEAVLIYDPDRLARRYSYQELVTEDLKESGIEVLYVTIGSPKNEEDKLMYGMRGLFTQYERIKIAERFRLGKLRKVKEGHILTTEGPYGYKYIRGDREKHLHGYYEINPEEARVAKMIFTWIAEESLTVRKVVLRLQELGIKPRRSKRGVWNTSTLTTMLRNRAYIGQAHWGSSYAVVPEKPTKLGKYRKIKKSSRKIKPRDEWIASNIPVPAIIDEQLFNKVREQLKRNFALCDRNKKNQYLLGGKIRCICGRTRNGEGPQHGKHLYYRCNDRNYSFPLPQTCNEGGINARIADKLVWDKVAELMSSPELITDQINHWSNFKQDKIKTGVSDIELIKKEVIKLKEQEERYAKAYGAGIITIEKLKEYTIPLRDQIASLDTQIVKARQEESQDIIPVIPNIKEISEFTKQAIEELKELNFETKRAIMMNLLDKVVGSQKQLEVSGILPITSNYVNLKTSYRNCRIAERGKEYPV